MQSRFFCGGAFLAILFGLILGSTRPASSQESRLITEYRLERETVEIPFEYHNHLILVTASVGDRTDLNMVVDTGASTLVLDKTLGIRGTHLGDIAFREAEGMTKAEAVLIDKLRVGPKSGAVEVRNVKTILTDLAQMSRAVERPLDGVIGMDCLAGYTLEIDYLKKKLRFLPSRLYTVAYKKPDNKTTFLLSLKANDEKSATSVMTVSGLLHPEYDQDFLVDTGFGGYLTVSAIAAQTAGMLKADTPRAKSFAYSVTRRFQTAKIRAPFLKIGEVDLKGKVISVDYRNNDEYGQFGILGNRMLQNYLATFDFQRKKLWLERNSAKEEGDDAERPSLGITLRSDGVRYVLDTVAANSPSYRAGLRGQEQILAIDGVNVASLTSAQVATLLANPKGETRLQVKTTDGSEREVKVAPSSPLDW